jgi:hypothetical protein
LGFGQLIYETELALSHLNNFFNEASADLVFNFRDSTIYQSNAPEVNRV